MEKLGKAMAEDGFKFEYELLDNSENEDKSYGSFIDGKWTGMIKLLLNGKGWVTIRADAF